MSHHEANTVLPSILRNKPLQVAKFVGILLSLVLGIAGFFRIINTAATGGGPLFGDGQFLALVLLPLGSLVLVFLVFAETLLTGYRILRVDASISEQFDGRVGYVLLRSAEAGIATIGVFIFIGALPPLFAESTSSPAGIGIMLLLFVVGIGIFLASFVRTTAELFVYRESTAVE